MSEGGREGGKGGREGGREGGEGEAVERGEFAAGRGGIRPPSRSPRPGP